MVSFGPSLAMNGKVGTYEKADFKFSLQGKGKSLTFFDTENQLWAIDLESISAFSIEEIAIKLNASKTENGFILTKEYGKMRIIQDSSSVALWLLPEQVEVLKKLITNQNQQQ